MDETRLQLSELPADVCWELLASHTPALGRVAFTARGGSVIHPMNYAVADRAVYLRTGTSSGLADVVDSSGVAFEVDDIDGDWEVGWSVLAQGTLREVNDADELDRHRELRLRTWAPGDRLFLLRLDVDRITGRRIA